MPGEHATELHKRLPRFDPSDPQVLADPYGSYAQLRRAGPLCRGRPGEWVVTRHEDVTALLKDKRLSVAFPASYQLYSAGDGAAAALRQRIVLTRDPPDHTRLRR